MSAEENTEEKVEKTSEEKPVDETGEESGENLAEGTEEVPEEKKERKFHTETIVITEAPKVRLITAFVMLAGSGFMAIYTMLQHYEIGAWIRTLFISLVIFFIVGRLFEFLVTHFDDLNKAKENAILAQEEAIAQREADELAAAEAAAEAQRLAAEEAAAREAMEAENDGLSDEDYSYDNINDFEIGDDLSGF
ncbi:hypothetical protein [Butyrivibrio sp. VCD2006]|uniref:hypothetical protein n=1 Tax=Butyrivibrio sp. VCD2006 TaxID=1280664 RepID=UPI00041C8BBD|nr:hypothetical protein [Butyrivibrio sp. VCD2006]